MRARPWVLLLAPSLLAGCAQPPGVAVMTCPTLPTSRPAAHPDPLPPVSGTALTLQPAHWDWADGGYVWSPAVWMPRPATSHVLWQNGSWSPNGGACVWNAPHFLP